MCDKFVFPVSIASFAMPIAPAVKKELIRPIIIPIIIKIQIREIIFAEMLDIKSEMISESKVISTTLTEVSLNRLNEVWDQEGSKNIGGTFLAIGTESGANEHTLTIVALRLLELVILI